MRMLSVRKTLKVRDRLVALIRKSTLLVTSNLKFSKVFQVFHEGSRQYDFVIFGTYIYVF